MIFVVILILVVAYVFLTAFIELEGIENRGKLLVFSYSTSVYPSLVPRFLFPCHQFHQLLLYRIIISTSLKM